MHSIDQLLRDSTDAPLGTVIHVGAGRGAVLEQYARLAPERVVLVEGDPDTASTLQRAARPYPWAQVVSRAAAAAAGDMTWNRYNLSALNGPLDVGALSGSYPRLHRRDATAVPAVALSLLLRDALRQTAAERSNLLVLDVPGQEAALLDSLGDELRSLSAVIVRRCALPLPGAAPWAAVLDRLRGRAFELVGHEADGEPLWPVARFRFDRRRHELGVLNGQVDALTQAKVAAEKSVLRHIAEVEDIRTQLAAAEKQNLALKSELSAAHVRNRELEAELHEARRTVDLAVEGRIACDQDLRDLQTRYARLLADQEASRQRMQALMVLLEEIRLRCEPDTQTRLVERSRPRRSASRSASSPAQDEVTRASSNGSPERAVSSRTRPVPSAEDEMLPGPDGAVR